MLPETQPKDYIQYKSVGKLSIYELNKWENILNVGYEKVEECIKSWDETYIENEEIRKFNVALFNEALKIAESFFKECNVPTKRYSSSNPFKSLGATKEWSLFVDKLQRKYKTSSPSKAHISSISYEGKTISTSSGVSLGTLKSAKCVWDNRKNIEEKKKNRFQKILLTAKLNGIDLSDCGSEEEMYKYVDDFMIEKYRDENYPDGASVYLKHACDECSEWTVGERRCSCGNRRISLVVEGDFINGYYAYPEAY